MSLFFTLPGYAPFIQNVAQILIYSCCRLLEEKNIHPQIKWPNDLMIGEAKFSGALAETIPLDSQLGVIIGLGMNVQSSVEIDQKTTSLAEIAPGEWDLNLLKKEIISRFTADLSLLQREGFAPFRQEFEKRLLYKGEKISCKVGEETITGLFLGLTDTGELQIKKTDGTIRKLYSAEIFTLRPQ